MRFMKFFPWVSILSVVLALLAGCANDKAVISQAQQEHQALKPAVMEDPELTGYMQAIGQRIIDAAHELDQQGVGPKTHKSEDTAWMFSKNMQFHLVNSKTLNAFTTGGEHMYIYNALFQQCSSEDELAAVMAHEYGHVYARHVEKGMNRQMVMMGGAALAGGAGYVAGGKEHGAEYAGLG
ncbi:MAG TPA: M48 family metalloprotease, partial [Tepidisphaeraceae bacterium]